MACSLAVTDEDLLRAPVLVLISFCDRALAATQLLLGHYNVLFVLTSCLLMLSGHSNSGASGWR